MKALLIGFMAMALVACSKQNTNVPPIEASTNTTVAPSQGCMSTAELTTYGTHFARKDVWEALPKVKNWSAVQGEYDLKAIEVTSSGEVFGSLGWHEGPSVCVQRRDGEFWARMLGVDDKEWSGPFLPIDAKDGFEVAYFNRVFGNACYKDAEAEQWCFGDGVIRVGPQVLKAKMSLDSSEMPGYGTPVSVDSEFKGFWVFVPSQGQWNVFRDDFVSKEGHVAIDPKHDAPWRVLIPM